MSQEIVKVQVALFPQRGDRMVLVYGRHRTNMVEQIADAKTWAAMGGSSKAYFNAQWTGAVWEIGERAKDQSW
jgi:hypothetical protein